MAEDDEFGANDGLAVLGHHSSRLRRAISVNHVDVAEVGRVPSALRHGRGLPVGEL